jgi:hypothetical protein
MLAFEHAAHAVLALVERAHAQRHDCRGVHRLVEDRLVSARDPLEPGEVVEVAPQRLCCERARGDPADEGHEPVGLDPFHRAAGHAAHAARRPVARARDAVGPQQLAVGRRCCRRRGLGPGLADGGAHQRVAQHRDRLGLGAREQVRRARLRPAREVVSHAPTPSRRRSGARGDPGARAAPGSPSGAAGCRRPRRRRASAAWRLTPTS